MRRRFEVWTAAWAIALAIGFALVFALGGPLPTHADELEAALHPTPPVTQQVAERSAATIVRIQYPDFVGETPTVERRTDYGIERWLITYSKSGPVLSGVHISVTIASGTVEVAAFP